MKIELMGSHPLAAVLGWFFSQAGHETVWTNHDREPKIDMDILDGRKEKRGIRIQNQWNPVSKSDKKTDWLVLIPAWGELENVVVPAEKTAVQEGVLVLAPCWTELKVLEQLLPGKKVFWGLPTAAGHWVSPSALQAAVLPGIHWGSWEPVTEEDRGRLEKFWGTAGFQPRFHEDLQAWLWISFAVNAGLSSQILPLLPATAEGTVEEAADLLFSSSRRLNKAVLAIREALQVVKARGADLKPYRNEVGPYSYPAWFAAFVLQGILKKNEPALDILKMPGGPDELADGLNEVLSTARELGISLKHLNRPR